MPSRYGKPDRQGDQMTVRTRSRAWGGAAVLLAFFVVTGCESKQQREEHLRLTAEVTALTLEKSRIQSRIDEAGRENARLEAEVDALTQKAERLEANKASAPKPAANVSTKATAQGPAHTTVKKK